MEYPKLGFPQAVKEFCSFLESEYHFRIKRLDETFVRYESENVFVEIYHGRVSREIGLEFGLLTSRGTLGRHSIGKLILLNDPENYRNYRYFATQTPEGVKKGVSQISNLLKSYGHQALLGNGDFFDQLKTLGKKIIHNRIDEDRAERIRPQAEEAFRSGDYGKAAELYGSIEPSLTPTEAKKLAFARSKLK